MSRGDLQEMEAGTKQSKTAVNSDANSRSNAKAPNYVPDNGAVEDLGGPTPENSKQMTILTSSLRRLKRLLSRLRM